MANWRIESVIATPLTAPCESRAWAGVKGPKSQPPCG